MGLQDLKVYLDAAKKALWLSHFILNCRLIALSVSLFFIQCFNCMQQKPFNFIVLIITTSLKYFKDLSYYTLQCIPSNTTLSQFIISEKFNIYNRCSIPGTINIPLVTISDGILIASRQWAVIARRAWASTCPDGIP